MRGGAGPELPFKVSRGRSFLFYCPNRENRFRALAGFASLSTLLLAWEVGVRTGAITSIFLPAPLAVIGRFAQLTYDKVLPRHAMVSIGFIVSGVTIATLLGIVTATLCYLSRTVDSFLHPLVEVTRGIAPLALIPLFMLIFGIGAPSKIAITVWVAWVPVFINTLEGARSVDPLHIRAARSFGASRIYTVWTVSLPSTAPFILSGIRLAFGAAFLAVVAAEMFGSTDGLGFFILETAQTFKILDMFAGIFAVGLIGWTINGLVAGIARWLMPWKRA